ncbi:hypothetical protein C2S52_006104 [Perilla frutescens var. hirtella]|nr:hypothetical protein C2S51_009675 [Perilla frutescens var. frutescens]KAH6786552.1 hypothetical protein C2S52_006104 [Perilla frutescens var. hirtella]
MEKLGDDIFAVLFSHLAAKIDDNISVYLAMVGTTTLPAGWEVNAFFNFFLYNHISDNYLCFRGKTRRFHAINSEWGYSKLISKKLLTDPSNGYLFNDNCVFGAEVFVIKKEPAVEHVSLLDFTAQCKHQWEISEFSKQENVWSSEEFFAGGYNWQIILYPNGNSTAQGGYVSIFFRCVDSESFAPHKKVYATCLFSFRNKLPNKSDHSMKGRGWFTSSGNSWGFSEFKEIGDMGDPTKGFVVDDCCHLEIELSVLAQHEALKLE